MRAEHRITAFPVPRLWPSRASGASWLRKFTSTHESGRAALYWALHGLGLPPGTTLWMPSYHCGVEADAARAAAYDVRFFRVGVNFAIDVEDFHRRFVDRPGPVLVIHYFGFPQPDLSTICRFCQDYGCMLIEDCAHALFSCDRTGRELGDLSSLAIFSLRKTLPLVDGGALRASGPARKPALDPLATCAYRIYLKTAVRRAVGARAASAYRSVRWRSDRTRRPVKLDDGGDHQRESYTKPMSRLSEKIATGVDPSEVVKRRRENFHSLDDVLQGTREYRPAWNVLPAGTCPLFLPVWVENREDVMARMMGNGVETFRFGASSPHELDAREFPESTTLREKILCLPIHQDLEYSEIERIGATFRTALNAKQGVAAASAV